MSRRGALGRVLGSIAAVVAAPACKKKPLVCDGLPGLTAEDIQLRKTLLYVDQTPVPEKACVSCTLYVPPAEADTCGGCKVLHGPIHPYGTCKIFLLKPEGGTPT